jgi:hypothetical protein
MSTTTKDVAKVKTTAVDTMGFDMEADAENHGQDFSAGMLLIPRIKILQDLSPEVKETKKEFVKGARPGMIFNELYKTLDEEFEFYPSAFTERYIAWRPRTKGGGLVDPNLTRDECEGNFTPDGIGRWIGNYRAPGAEEAERVEVQETPEWIGIARSKSFEMMPVVISFPSTKVKSVREINTLINLTRRPRANGEGTFRPPAFAHGFRFRTGIEQGNENEWYGWVIEHIGCHPDKALDPIMISEARAMKLKVDEGKVRADDSGLDRG